MSVSEEATALATQKKWSERAFWISTLLALATLGWAICHRLGCKCLWGQLTATTDEWPGKILILCWVVLPPLWFFFEWIVLCPKLAKEDRERIAHTHDLARNVWLAFVGLLIVILEVKGVPGAV